MITAKVGRIDMAPAIAKGADVARRATTMVTLAAREDTKPYVPYVTGALRSSAEIESAPEAGQLVYGSANVPYARAQYYGLPGKTCPGTVMQWFEASRAANLGKWMQIAKAEAAR
ncbi:MAG: minor capsid protein [Coriobacteriales bacterium]|jgi:hypothetical protein|nr:minor capsid protein [Coriobacteriales bacterium]